MIAAAVRQLSDRIAARSAAIGQRVVIDPGQVLDRSGHLALAPPGLWSPNRACRLVQALDGWLAVNLPRDSDLLAVPAWIGCDLDDEPWPAIVARARDRPRRELLAQARLLGLAVAMVGEVEIAAESGVPAGGAGRPRSAGGIKVVDLSTLWAGPLCGAILAEAGASVTKVESRGRPDGARLGTPAFHGRLNGAKRLVDLAFSEPADLTALRAEIAAADVVISSARPRAFAALDITPQAMWAINPRLIWVAVTGYGWSGDGADRVAFGDDAAAAGGLVGWTDGTPRFLGDALADPLTGLWAAGETLAALQHGEGVMVDAALARVAARVRANAL